MIERIITDGKEATDEIAAKYGKSLHKTVLLEEGYLHLWLPEKMLHIFLQLGFEYILSRVRVEPIDDVWVDWSGYYYYLNSSGTRYWIPTNAFSDNTSPTYTLADDIPQRTSSDLIGGSALVRYSNVEEGLVNVLPFTGYTLDGDLVIVKEVYNQDTLDWEQSVYDVWDIDPITLSYPLVDYDINVLEGNLIEFKGIEQKSPYVDFTLKIEDVTKEVLSLSKLDTEGNLLYTNYITNSPIHILKYSYLYTNKIYNINNIYYITKYNSINKNSTIYRLEEDLTEVPISAFNLPNGSDVDEKQYRNLYYLFQYSGRKYLYSIKYNHATSANWRMPLGGTEVNGTGEPAFAILPSSALQIEKRDRNTFNVIQTYDLTPSSITDIIPTSYKMPSLSVQDGSYADLNVDLQRIIPIPEASFVLTDGVDEFPIIFTQVITQKDGNNTINLCPLWVGGSNSGIAGTNSSLIDYDVPILMPIGTTTQDTFDSLQSGVGYSTYKDTTFRNIHTNIGISKAVRIGNTIVFQTIPYIRAGYASDATPDWDKIMPHFYFSLWKLQIIDKKPIITMLDSKDYYEMLFNEEVQNHAYRSFFNTRTRYTLD